MMSVLPTKDSRLVDVSTLVTEEEFVQLGRRVRCWTTRQSVSAQQDAIQVSPSVSRTRDVPETKHVSTSSARIPVMARYVPEIPPVLLKITNQSVNFVLLALWWTLIMDVFKAPMLDVGVTASVPPSRPVRTRSVSTRAVLACVLPHRIARWPIIGQSVSMCRDVNVRPAMTVERPEVEDTNVRIVNVSEILWILRATLAVTLMTMSVHNVLRMMTVLKTSTATDSRENVFLSVLDSVETTQSAVLPTTTPSVPVNQASKAMQMLAVVPSQSPPTLVSHLPVVLELSVSWTMAIPSAPVPEARQAILLSDVSLMEPSVRVTSVVQTLGVE